MPAIITLVEEFKGKDGRQWAKVSGITEKGTVVDVFTSKAEADAWELPVGAIVTKEQLAEIFKTLPVVEVVYNERGKVSTIKA